LLRAGQLLSGDEQLGLMLGRRTSLMALGPLGNAMGAAPTVRSGLQVLQEFTRLHTSYIQLRAQARLTGLRVEFYYTHDPGDLRRFHTETALLAIQQYVEGVTALRLDGASYQCDFEEPGYSGVYREYLHGPVVFNSLRASVEIPRRFLDMPSPYFDAPGWESTVAELSRRLRARSDDTSPYTRYVQALLRTSEPPLPDLASLSTGLNTSERTLNRRLQAEGSSFRELKSEALANWARLYLDHTDKSVESIAASLGYQDTANFRRAFRKRAGCSPNEYRLKRETA
jgi:AraC-like DNA-binding protein